MCWVGSYVCGAYYGIIVELKKAFISLKMLYRIEIREDGSRRPSQGGVN